MDTKPDVWVQHRYRQWLECFAGYWSTEDLEEKVIDGIRYHRYVYQGFTRDRGPIQEIPKELQTIIIDNLQG